MIDMVVLNSSSTGVWNRSSRGSTSSTCASSLPRCALASKPERCSTSATLPRTKGMSNTLSAYTDEVYRPMKRHSRTTLPLPSISRIDT
ncbi:hypothetical protein D9M71_474540 [compost metagenome]